MFCHLTLALTVLAAAPGAPPGEINGIELVWIPPGSFTMGCADASPGSPPVHQVTLGAGFWMGRYDVTVGQFRRFADETGYRTEAERADNPWRVWTGSKFEDHRRCWREPGYPQDEQHPAVWVSWNDAHAFLRWMNQKGGGGFRLPTEAEWEYACRAGSNGSSYGPLDAVAWLCVDNGSTTHPVGQKQPNAFGLYDMLGNAWQWCEDWYGDLPGGPATDPRGPASGRLRVARGGGWYGTSACARAGFNDTWEPDDPRHPDFRSFQGFRLVRSVP
jgi:formylglycine-generating enzyme required for sulfatase activity